MAGTAEIGMSPDDSATGRDVPHTRLRAIVVTPSGSTADQASPRLQRQHFRVRDPHRTCGLAKSRSPNPCVEDIGSLTEFSHCPDKERTLPPLRISRTYLSDPSLGRDLVSLQQAINEGAERRLRMVPIRIVEIEAGTRQ